MNTVDIILSNPLVALFAVIGVGMLLGNLKIASIGLGSSAVLFTGLLCGHLGYSIPDQIGTIGLVLFVYCVGISAGGRFFSALAKEGSTLAKLAVMIVGTAALLTWLSYWLLDIPTDLAVGIFAGAMTSTPALAAATEGLPDGSSGVVIGYGIAYPFGVIGVVLFVQLAPRLFRQNLDKIAAESVDPTDEISRVETALVEITNPNLFGKLLADLPALGEQACHISRVLKGERLVPITYDMAFEQGQQLLLVGRSRELAIMTDYLGKKIDKHYIKDVENEQQRLVVTHRNVIGQSLRELNALKEFGVMITRITRMDFTFAPDNDTKLENRDILKVVGNPDDLKRFAKHIGHRSEAFDETDLLSLSLGITLGIIVGMIPFTLPGAPSISLGLAGGPLFVALILGHFGRIGRIVGHIPRPTRQLLQELGLVLFLADAGVKGGAALVATVAEMGPVLFLVGCLITLLPMLITYVLAEKVFKLNALQALGGICGGMTSTPALGALTGRSNSKIPVVSYATAYPVALIVMTIFAKMLIALMGGL